MAWPRMVALEIMESSVILGVRVYMVELTGFSIDSVMMVRKRGLEDATDPTTRRMEAPLTEMGQAAGGVGWVLVQCW